MKKKSQAKKIIILLITVLLLQQTKSRLPIFLSHLVTGQLNNLSGIKKEMVDHGRLTLTFPDAASMTEIVHSDYFVKYGGLSMQNPGFSSSKFDIVFPNLKEDAINTIVVTKTGVYHHEMPNSWMNILYLMEESSKSFTILGEIGDFEGSQEITAANSITNDTMLSIGFDNLKVYTYNFDHSPESSIDFSPIHQIQLERQSEEDRIDFISRIPLTSTLVVSPGKAQIFKIWPLTGETTSYKNPMDTYLRELKMPGLTHRASLSGEGGATRAIAIARDSDINMVLDYTSMNMLRTFSIKYFQRFVKEENSQAIDQSHEFNKIDAIEYYGYDQQSQYYLLANKKKPYVYFYTSTFNKLDDYKIISDKISNLKWLNHTTYVYYSTEDQKCGFYNALELNSDLQHRVLQECQSNQMGSIKIDMAVFDMEMGLEPNDVDEKLGLKDLSFVYIPFEVYQDKVVYGWTDTFEQEESDFGHKVNILWPECAMGEDNPDPDHDYDMVYGRYKRCTSCRSGYVHKQEKVVFDIQVDQDFISTYKGTVDANMQRLQDNFRRRNLEEVPEQGGTGPENFRFGEKSDTDTFFTYPNGKKAPISFYHECLKFTCNDYGRSRKQDGSEILDIPHVVQPMNTTIDQNPTCGYFSLKLDNEHENNHCLPGYSPNDLGICQRCPYNNLEQNGDYLCDSCYAFVENSFRADFNFGCESERKNFVYCKNSNPFEYAIEKIDQNYLYKSIDEDEQIKSRTIFGNLFNGCLEPETVTHSGSVLMFQKERLDGYLLVKLTIEEKARRILAEGGYVITVEVENLEQNKDVDLDFEFEGDLSSVTSVSKLSSDFYEGPGDVLEASPTEDCGRGYFFNNVTLECQGCSSQCSSCSSFTQCSSCNEEFFMEGTDIGTKCSPCKENCRECSNGEDCQTCHGNFLLFNDECFKKCEERQFFDYKKEACFDCPSNCEKCEAAEEKAEQGQCYKCDPSYLTEGPSCIREDDCFDGKVIRGDQECLKCQGVDCETCDPFNLEICLSCKEGWKLSENSQKCYDSDRSGFRWVLVGIFGITALITLVGALIGFVCQNKTSSGKGKGKGKGKVSDFFSFFSVL